MKNLRNNYGVKLFIFIIRINQIVFVKSDQFESKPVQVKIYENETVLLPCYINDDASSARVRWHKSSILLADTEDPGHLPPGYRLHSNFSLEIERPKREDSGEFTCEVIRPDPWGVARQSHYVLVQFPPTVKTTPEDGYLEVRKGDYVDIGCEVSGAPTPSVDWKKNGESMALLEHRSRIRFKAEHRLLAGVYECTVNNGIGDPVTGSISVLIQDAPVVSTDRSFVHTAIDLRADLAARLEFAVPSARTLWFKDGVPVKTDQRVMMMVHNDIHQLVFRSVRKSDFGNYTFRAENSLGMADVSFKLTGVPNVASFKVDQRLNNATQTSFTLVWEVDSYSEIIEYNLWLRPYHARGTESNVDTEPNTNKWSRIVIPGDGDEGPIHSATYTVRSLTPATVYEAIITSRNRFGWSKTSAILHFATEAYTKGVKKAPSTADYSELLTPILEDIEPQHSFNTSLAHFMEHEEEDTNDSCQEPRPSWIVAILLTAFYLAYVS